MVLNWRKDKKLIKNSLKIMLSVTLSQMIITAIGFIDVFMLSQYESSHFSAIGMASEIWFIFQAPLVAFGTLFGILYSQYQKNKENFNNIIKLNIWFAVILAFVISILMITIGKKISDLYFLKDGHDKYTYIEKIKIKSLINNYLEILAIGNIFATFSVHAINPIVMVKKAKYMLYMALVGLISNIINNVLFIYVMDMGIIGAGISTSISYFFEFIFAVFIIYKNREIFSKISNFFVINKKTIKAFFKHIFVAISSIIMFWTYAGNSILIAFQYGAKVIQSISVSYSISGIMFAIMPGIRKLINIIIGKSLGENNFKKAIENSKKLVWVVLLVTVIIIFLASMLALFVPQITINDPKYADYAKWMILIFAGSFLGYSLQAYYSGILETGGKQLIPAIFNYFVPLWLQIPLIVISSPLIMGLNFIYMFLFHQMMIYLMPIILIFIKRKNKWIINLNNEYIKNKI